MLDPEERTQTLETLRPPLGYELDCAIATTFSLDLIALLTAPLAFTLFDWEDQEGRQIADPLAILESLRRYAERISIFCQSGHISVPKHSQQLFSHLEASVFQLSLDSGVFHAKTWVLRFISSDQPVTYRVIVPSRNLTFDRCWDTVLVLEGELTVRRKAFALNNPIGDFINALPQLCKSPLPQRTRRAVQVMQDELRRVDFRYPEQFRKLHFWPIGLDGKRTKPFKNKAQRTFDRVLIISPFVNDGGLTRLNGRLGRDVLISRPDELAKLSPTTLSSFRDVFVLNPSAGLNESAEPEDTESLSGLHAKLYIGETGGLVQIWTGSANATNAAFAANVEFLVECEGDKSTCGIDAFLSGAANGTSFRELLQEFDPSSIVVDAEHERLEKIADDVRRKLADQNLTATVSSNENDFAIALAFEENISLPSGVSVRCRPITLSDARLTLLSTDVSHIAVFAPVSFEAITSFYAFKVTVTEAKRMLEVNFVLNGRLLGAPEDRKERILTSLLSDKSAVLKFMLLLLAEGGADSTSLLLALRRSRYQESDGRSAEIQFPLFEALVRTLDRNPAKLDQISRLVNDLKRTESGRNRLPDGFDEIWKPLWTAREGIRRKSESTTTKH
jgi:hypothetical protein